MYEIFGGEHEVGWVVAKAVLLYLTAVIGFRLGERRTLSEMGTYDFVAAAAVGAIVGRVPNATDTTYLGGFATLVSVLGMHRLLTRLRHRHAVSRLLEHPAVVLIVDGEVDGVRLKRCGLTIPDLHAMLRRQRAYDLAAIRYAIYEPRGGLTIVYQGDDAMLGADGPLDEVLPAR